MNALTTELHLAPCAVVVVCEFFTIQHKRAVRKEYNDDASMLLDLYFMHDGRLVLTAPPYGFAINYVYVPATTTHDWLLLMLAIKTVQT